MDATDMPEILTEDSSIPPDSPVGYSIIICPQKPEMLQEPCHFAGKVCGLYCWKCEPSPGWPYLYVEVVRSVSNDRRDYTLARGSLK
jgi:hypothetical protein